MHHLKSNFGLQYTKDQGIIIIIIIALKKLSTLMFGNGLVTLPIQENFYGGAPTEMISAVMINYFSQSSVTETLKAEHMLTLSLFQANGQKMKVKLRSPVILGISIIFILVFHKN